MKNLVVYLLVGAIGFLAPSSGANTEGRIGLAVNLSHLTTCAEEDNVNYPIHTLKASHFKITASHPTYEIGEDNCDADFSGCSAQRSLADTCTKVWDDGVNVIEVCDVPDWWRPYAMTVNVNGVSDSGHYFRWSRKIEDEASWPQFLVLYEDGNMRLKPHPPAGRRDTCFGSSVVIGPAKSSSRPYADIESVDIDPAFQLVNVIYRQGATASLSLSVSRDVAVAEVDADYSGPKPLATFRSMWVDDGNCDVDHIRVGRKDWPILTDKILFPGRWWFFYREMRSEHNASAPDILIDLSN